MVQWSSVFQSTSFIRRMTEARHYLYNRLKISIHILHTKDDRSGMYRTAGGSDFNPHPSYEGWRLILHSAEKIFYFNPHPSYEGWQRLFLIILRTIRFQSTSFIRRMTLYNAATLLSILISIHILHTKDDSWLYLSKISRLDFNPHPSYEGWRKCQQGWQSLGYFNPHPSYEGWHW